MPRHIVVAIVLSAALARPALAQCPDGAPPPCARTGPAPNSVAVLRFESPAGDTSLNWLGDGLAEEIATELGAMHGLLVRGEGIVRSAQHVAGADPRRVARLVTVRYVVEGSYRSAGGGVRISARLLELPSGNQRWGQVYDRRRDSLATLSDDIAGDVARALGAAPAARAPSRHVADPRAYEAYLRARYQFLRGDIEAAVVLFQEAVARDSLLAPAWAGLALNWGELADGVLAPLDAYPRSREAAHRALALDSSQVDAWLALAYAAGALDRDCQGGQRMSDRAIAIDSTNSDAWVLLAGMLACQGHGPQALVASRRALVLDSLSGFAATYYLETADLFAPTQLPSLYREIGGHLEGYLGRLWAGRVALARGDCSGAAEILRRFGGNDAHYYVTALVCEGRRAAADSVVRALVADTTHGYVNPVGVAISLLAIGDKDGAEQWFERGIEQHTFWVLVFPLSRDLAALRGDPRYEAALRRIGVTSSP